MSTDGVFKGSVLVHVIICATDGRLLGLAKGFKMVRMAKVDEVYLDELLVAEETRGQRLAQHLIVALLDACKREGSRVTRVRLMCVRGEKVVGGRKLSLHKKVYGPMAINKEWEAPRSVTSPWAGVGLRDEDKETCIMLHGEGAAVREAADTLAGSAPLGEPLKEQVAVLVGMCY